MTLLETPVLLQELRRRGARLMSRGDSLRIVAPQGVMTDELKQAVRERKPEILQQIRCEIGEHPVLAMPLSLFEQEGAPVHLEVPGLPETLWFVPTEEDAAGLLEQGIRRARVWTARELRELLSQPGLTPEDTVTIARARLVFDATVVGYDRVCHGVRFWRMGNDAPVCATCHPPADPETVDEWLQMPDPGASRG